MTFSLGLPHSLLKVFILGVFVLNTPTALQAASDSARVITTHTEKSANKQTASGKVATDKSAVVALINLEEVMPECQQHVAKAKIKSIQRSESGITTESITFNWANANVTIPTHMSDNPLLTLDDLVDATKFIKVGNTYFIHFQTCEQTQEKSLVNIYAI